MNLYIVTILYQFKPYATAWVIAKNRENAKAQLDDLICEYGECDSRWVAQNAVFSDIVKAVAKFLYVEYESHAFNTYPLVQALVVYV